MGSFLIWLLVCLVVNLLVDTLVGFLGGNYYLATMITSIVLSFIVSIMSIQFDRKHFYRYKFFWIYFLSTCIIFLLIDLLIFII